MVFVIDNRVFYRSEDGAIWPSGDEGSTVILTLTMNRLLTCLLEKHGQVLTRNELLDNVWDAHGLRSSSHTLNKYISEQNTFEKRLWLASSEKMHKKSIKEKFKFFNSLFSQLIECFFL